MGKEVVIDIKVTAKQAQENLDELNESLELQQNLVDDLERELAGYNKKMREISSTTSKTSAVREALNKKIQETKNKLIDEKQGLKDVKKERDKTNKQLKEAKDAQADYSGAVGIADRATGGLIGTTQGFIGSLKGATKGMNLFKVAVMGTGIGALVIAVGSLVAAFKGSEEGQNKFAKIMSVINAIIGNFVDLMADIGEQIISAFENPKETIKGFVNLLKQNIINRFEGLLELVPKLSEAIGLLFKGQFGEAGKVAGDAVAKVALGVEDITEKTSKAIEKTKEFVKEQIKEGSAAAKVADMRAEADKIERKLIVDRSKLESKIAQLRLKARQENEFSEEERKEALLEAQKLEDQLLDKETEFLELRRDAIILENTFSRTNKENLTKQAEAEAAVNRQIATRANVARTLQRELNTIDAQIEAKNTKKINEEKRQEKELNDFKLALRDSLAISEDEKRELELTKISEHYQKLYDKAVENKLNEDELQAIKDAEQLARNEKQAEFEKTDLDRRQAEADKIAEIEQQKRDQQQQTLDTAIQIFGEESRLGKAVLVAKQLLQAKEFILNAKSQIANAKKNLTDATVDVAKAGTDVGGSIAKATNTAPPPFNIPFILTAVATGASVISGIKSALGATKQAAASAGASGGGGVNVSAPRPTVQSAPAFNIIGNNPQTQLAEAISSGQNRPIKTYVVSSEVSTAQALDRNIVTEASI